MPSALLAGACLRSAARLGAQRMFGSSAATRLRQAATSRATGAALRVKFKTAIPVREPFGLAVQIAQGVRARSALAVSSGPLWVAPALPPLLPALSARGLAAAIIGFARREPYKVNLAIATVKTALCDLLVQRYLEKKEAIDWKRNALFWAFGLVYLGAFQWHLYVTLFKRWWPGMATFAEQPLRAKLANRAGMRDLFKQVGFDNFVHYTMFFFPAFYIMKEAIHDPGKSIVDPGGASANDTGLYGGGVAMVGRALGNYGSNFAHDNLTIWAVWVPADLVAYAAPIYMRLPLIHVVSFFYTCYLSYSAFVPPDRDSLACEGHA